MMLSQTGCADIAEFILPGKPSYTQWCNDDRSACACIGRPQIVRKFHPEFVIFSEILLDNPQSGWYYIRARVGRLCACTAMMREIALKNGNFRGVCPVIGRLNCLVCACVYRCAYGNGSASVGHFSWLRVIRTAARTSKFDRTQPLRKLSTIFKEENKPWQTR